jgi:hypothetical protein
MAKLVKAGLRHLFTTVFRDLLRTLVSLLCSIDFESVLQLLVEGIAGTPVAVQSPQEVEEGRNSKDVEYEFRR